MNSRNKILVISLSTVIVGISVYLIVNKQKKKKLYAQLLKNLETGVNQTGTIDDLGTKGGPFDPTYYKTAGAGAALLKVADAQNLSKSLRSAIGGSFGISNEEKVYSIFKGLKAKSQVSFLAEQYKKLYNVDMLEDVKKIDYTVGGLNWGGTVWLSKIQSLINSMPAK